MSGGGNSTPDATSRMRRHQMRQGFSDKTNNFVPQVNLCSFGLQLHILWKSPTSWAAMLLLRTAFQQLLLTRTQDQNLPLQVILIKHMFVCLLTSDINGLCTVYVYASKIFSKSCTFVTEVSDQNISCRLWRMKRRVTNKQISRSI